MAIARALVNQPRLILADEPTGNLDSDHAEEVLATLRRSNLDHGTTIILVTHDQEVGAACDRIIRMRDGRIREDEARPTAALAHAVAPEGVLQPIG